MTYIQAIVLGIVQGLTEFLPISSSAHLALLSKVSWWNAQPLVFDTTLHLATALTLIIFFSKDIWILISDLLRDVRLQKTKIKEYSQNGRFALMIAVGSLPAVILGFLFESDFENRFRSIEYIMLFLMLGTILMFIAQKLEKIHESTNDLSFKSAITIGLFQSLALFPGLSRSGSTISGGLIVGLNRYRSARFSFLLSLPIVLVAGGYKILTTNWQTQSLNFGILLVGFISSFLVGLMVIHFLMNYLKSHNLNVFIWYRILLVLFLLLIH